MNLDCLVHEMLKKTEILIPVSLHKSVYTFQLHLHLYIAINIYLKNLNQISYTVHMG